MADQAVMARRRRLPGDGATWALVLLAVGCLPVAFLAEGLLARITGFAVAASITLTAALLNIWRFRRERAELATDDPALVCLTDSQGQILFENPAARDRFGPREGQPMSRALAGLIPNASAIAFRHETTLMRDRAARETVVTRRGSVKITAFRIGAGTLWRVDEAEDGAGRAPSSNGLPMMVVSRNDTILSMNDAMRRTLGERRKALSEVFETLPVQSGQRTRIRAAEDWT